MLRQKPRRRQAHVATPNGAPDHLPA
jgi:hypothetical protein